MINVSKEFQQLMNQRTDFKENAEITFVNGTTIELSEKDFTISNNNIVDSSETNGIPLGVAVCRSIQIELMNDDDRFSEYDFFGAKIHLYLTFQLSETVEKIEYGTFTVLAPETYGETVIITALDDMYKADASYQTSLLFPSTLRNVLIDACTTVGISLGSTTFINDDFEVQSKPVDLTYRELFGYIAMIAGGNARIDTSGRLRIISYNFSELESVYDGGSFKPWNNPTDLDGGSFNPWDIGDVADGGTFEDRKGIHVLNNWKNLKVDTDDVVITGVSLTYTDSNNEEKTIMHGVEGYVLNVENPLIEGKDIALIGNIMVGGRFRQFSGDLVANPTCEFMDSAMILDRKGNFYTSFLTDINFQFFGFTTLKNSANPALRNSAKTYSAATKSIVAAKKLVKNERTARELATEQLAKDLKNSSGLFMTEEVQDDGSIIYYMHDKPTLAESMVVWKLTALAFGISTDGGKTYPYGFTVDGETITRLLYAEGINADYITTGIIQSKDGSASINLDNGVVSIKSNHFSWASTYSSLSSDGKLKATDVDLAGKITATSGEIGGMQITSKSISSGKESYNDDSKSGVYLGTDGFAIGYNTNTCFKVSSLGAASIRGYIDIVASPGALYSRYESTQATFAHGQSTNAKISYTGLIVSTIYGETTLASDSLKIRYSTSGESELTHNSLKFSKSATIESTLYNGSISILANSLNIGDSTGKLSFFEGLGSTKKSVSTITSTSSATASTNATKINELINALKAYNLIG